MDVDARATAARVEWDASTVARESPESFDARIRASYGASAHARVRGVCVLDVCATNVMNFEQGSFRLVRRDLRLALGETLGEATAQFLDAVGAIEDAFSVRKNIVNLKKVLLHAQSECEDVARALNQLTTFYRSDLSREGDYRSAGRYREIAVAGARCRGTFLGIFDARMFTKEICCIPRMPDACRPKRLAAMPRTLVTHGFVKKGLEVLGQDAPEELRFDASGPHGNAWVPDDSTHTALADDFNALIDRVTQCLAFPPHVVEFIRCALIARGAAKALVMRREIAWVRGHAKAVCSAAEWTMRALRASHRNPDEVLREDMGVDSIHGAREPPSEDALECLRVACVVDRAANALEGAAPVTAETAKWLDKILDAPQQTLFAAGDSDATTSFVPDEFVVASLVASYAPVIEKYQKGMLSEVARALTASVALTPSAEDNVIRTHLVKGSKVCKRCQNAYSNLWLTNRTCLLCIDAARTAGVCPMRDRCVPRAFCPHARVCLACERRSCEKCGLLCGDAEDVVAIVESCDADAVFLDFDRTVCATKRGASPLPAGALERLSSADSNENLERELAALPSADADFIALLCAHPNAYIITRNSHTREIEAYLRLHGVRNPKVIHSRKGESKAVAVASALERRADGAPTRALVFVDDDARELVREDVQSIPGLRRVLFSRAAS